MEIIFVRHGQSTQNIAYSNNTTYDPNNVSLTKLGETQAETTGEYLKKFGKYDAIFSSPLLRAIQTSNIIKNKLNFKNDIIVDNRLKEHNIGNLEGLKQDDVNEYINKNKQLITLLKRVDDEPNLYKKYKLNEKFTNMYFEYVKSTLTIEDQLKNAKSFLNFIKKQNYKRILVISHGGIMDVISSIICNTNVYNQDIKIVLNNPDKKIYSGNCDVVGVLLENNKFSLVIPRNNMHVQNL
jgi:broad specificity phosphatase PhoE